MIPLPEALPGMFKILVIQMDNLSDERAEFLINDRRILAISAGAAAVRLALRPCRKLAWFCSGPLAGFYFGVDSVNRI
jgi:hypothetical protein